MTKIQELFDNNVEEYNALKHRVKIKSPTIDKIESPPPVESKETSLVDQGSMICQRYNILVDSLGVEQNRHLVIQSLKLLSQEIDILLERMDTKLDELNSIH